MKVGFGAIAFFLMFQGQSCDLNQMAQMSPEQIKLQTEGELRTYFPRARVWVSETERAVIGLTCVANLGRSVIEQMVPLIDRSDGVKKLKETRKKYASFEDLASLLNAKLITYRYFMLGFDDFLIRLDADSNQYGIIQTEQITGYDTQYAAECGVGPPSDIDPAPMRESQAQQVFIWIGVFEVTAQGSDGETRTFQATDTLGLYTEEDFELVRSEEVNHREQLMRWFMEEKQLKVSSVLLVGVKKIRVPQETLR